MESSDDVDSGSQSLESLMFRFSLPQFVYAVPHHTPNAAQMLDCIYLSTALGNNSKPVPSYPIAKGDRLAGGLSKLTLKICDKPFKLWTSNSASFPSAFPGKLSMLFIFQ